MKKNQESYMKRHPIIVILVSLAGVCSWQSSVYALPGHGNIKGSPQIEYAAADAKAKDEDKSDSGLQTGEGEGDWKDPDSERNINLDKKQDDDSGIIARLKEYKSIRKKRDAFAFHMGFSIGALGYGVLGPRYHLTDRYQFMYEKGSFNAGFRGGVEALFFLARRHCLSIGAFYEQKKIQIKIVDLPLMYFVAPAIPPEFLYLLPLYRFIDKSNVDTNYITFPVAYRYYVLDELYIGLSLDVGVLFLAKANYGITFYSTHMNFRKYLPPVDFGGRVLFGFTMNRVFIELGLGAGFLDYDRLGGERHTISLSGMIGYKI
jgi:hypothetical protein